jgi:PAS domain S-box-containing protein
MAEHIQSVFYVATADLSRILYVSPAYETVWGRSGESLYREPLSWLDAVHPADRARVDAMLREGIGRGQYAAEYRVVRPDGDVRWVWDRAFEIADAAGRPYRTVGVVEDITPRKRLEAEILAARAHLETLSHRLMEAQEAERRHLARELHDEVGQNLTALQLALHAVRRAAPAAGAAVDAGLRVVASLLEQVRTLSLRLRPSMLDDLGLVAALNWLVHDQGQRAGIAAEFRHGPWLGRLSSAVETACFRIAQEALTNVVRHARATRVVVALEMDEHSLHLTVQDDGVGFDVAAVRRQSAPQASLGLLGMEERVVSAGGRIEFKSTAGAGTEIHAQIPLQWAPQPPPASDLNEAAE